jgi:nucleotide-binding universal stress UspA family protein
MNAEGGDDRPTIVVGVDGSLAGQTALQWAIDEAGLRGAEVVALHAWEPVITSGAIRGAYYRPEQGDDIARTVLDDALAGVEVPDDVRVERRTVCREPSHAVCEAAEGADLIVVGSHHRGAVGRWALGSVSTKVVHHAPCPVVVVPAER